MQYEVALNVHLLVFVLISSNLDLKHDSCFVNEVIYLKKKSKPNSCVLLTQYASVLTKVGVKVAFASVALTTLYNNAIWRINKCSVSLMNNSTRLCVHIYRIGIGMK